MCSIRVELRSWSRYVALSTRLDKYRVFFHTSNCKTISSPYSYCAPTILKIGGFIIFGLSGCKHTCETNFNMVDLISSCPKSFDILYECTLCEALLNICP